MGLNFLVTGTKINKMIMTVYDDVHSHGKTFDKTTDARR
jgi:hypothetical protein